MNARRLILLTSLIFALSVPVAGAHTRPCLGRHARSSAKCATDEYDNAAVLYGPIASPASGGSTESAGTASTLVDGYLLDPSQR